MKRIVIAFIIIFAILSGVPEAFRQYRAVRDSGADWLKTKMFEGFIHSAEGSALQQSCPRCEPTTSVVRNGEIKGTNQELADLQIIGKINLGASSYVFE
jgi:hypothetical protein